MNAESPKSSARQNIIARADELYQRGQCDDAVDLLLEGLRQSADDEAISFRLSEIMIESGHFQDAQDVLGNLPADDSAIRQLELLGYCKAGLNQDAEAETLTDRILNTNSKSAPALNLKGILANRRGDTLRAESFFKRAIEANPEFGDAYMHLGKLKWKADPEAAIRLFEKGFTNSPLINEVVTSYHSAIAALERFTESEPVLRHALQIHPFNKRLRFLLIDIYLQQSRFQAAMAEIETAMGLFGPADGLLPPALNVRQRLGPMTITQTAGKMPTVSLCMITKNEAQHLATCLRSVKPIVDEIIIVDTGSTDQTRDIALVFGAQVYGHDWTEDFSAARNDSISKAAGDWILIMDADEVISSRDVEAFLRIIKRDSSEPAAYSVVTRNYTHRNNFIGWHANDGLYAAEEAGRGWYPSEKVRLFPNQPGIRFRYPVHELVDPSLTDKGINIRKCSIPIHHYGKLDTASNRGKANAYFKIGFKKLDAMGDNPIALRELAIQAGNLEKFAEAIELWQRLIALDPDSAEAYINLAAAYLHVGRYREALLASQSAVKLAPHIKETHFNYAMSELFGGNAKSAIAAIERILEQTPNYPAAQFMLAAAFCCAGQAQKGAACFERIKGTAMGPALPIACQELSQKLATAGRHDFVSALLETAGQCFELDETTRLLMKRSQRRKNNVMYSQPQQPVP